MIIARALTCAALAFAALLVAPLASKAEGPGLKVDSQWPKPLPNNWILGQIGGIAVDGQDNIWVFQRPRSLTDDEKGAALADGPKYFEELMTAVGSRDGREIVLALEALRGREALDRDGEGRYFIGGKA